MPKKVNSISEYSDSSLRRMFGYMKHNNQPITDEWNDVLAQRFPTRYDPVTRSFRDAARGYTSLRDLGEFGYNLQDDQPRRKPQINIPSKNGLFVVTTRYDAHNKNTNVYINNVKVLEKATKLKMKTFMDKMVLGIQYTDIDDITQWRLWDAAARPIVFSNDSDLTIQQVNCVKDVLYALADTRIQVSVSKKNIMRSIEHPAQFKIDQSKTR